ncbi:sortase family protein [Sulfobacillus acidophilus TPY]|uniref:Sortase family protein n=1 Tax=Sulfobacillus acidophilus (strain ATCC 700253 / DSM 10332 / NAL) TaxID=679936 RepID=G8TT07_SULAD|nr:sortase family protein [Sulfobacillus acidophilus TPY]AEW05622.1 sortase family protein [Sulfobacillus acidophilus DSM 10332]
MLRRRQWGFGLAGIGLGLIALPIWIGPAARVAATQLTRPMPGSLSTRRLPTAAPVIPAPPNGSVVAQLVIPALRLNVPVVQGTGFGQLFFNPGHYAGSVLPGEPGTSVIAAHNATFFRHLNALHRGSRITVETRQGTFLFAVTGAQVVSDTAGLPNTVAPSLDLEACYPLNALYFTPDRYIVFSRLIRSSTGKPVPLLPSAKPSVTRYHANIPTSIESRFSLSLADNSLPMGSLTYHAPHTAEVLAFEESPNPLEAETVAISLWLAYVDASRSGNRSALAALGVRQNQNPYWQARSVVFEAPLNVQMTVTGTGLPIRIIMTNALVRINGEPFQTQMTITITGTTLTIQEVGTAPSIL